MIVRHSFLSGAVPSKYFLEKFPQPLIKTQMKIPKTRFEMLTTEQRISAIELTGTYLTHRMNSDFVILLYGVSGYYVEVWQTHEGSIWSVNILKDEEAIELYLSSVDHLSDL
jgi:hypothetical protein